MPQDALILKLEAVASALDLANFSVKWAKFAGLSDAFAEKSGAIFDHCFLRNLDFANQAWLLRRRVRLCFFSLTRQSTGHA